MSNSVMRPLVLITYALGDQFCTVLSERVCSLCPSPSFSVMVERTYLSTSHPLKLMPETSALNKLAYFKGLNWHCRITLNEYLYFSLTLCAHFSSTYIRNLH